MATVIEGKTGQQIYPEVIQHVLRHGRLRAPRGATTLDAGMTIIDLAFPSDALPLGCGRDLNCGIAAAEAAQLIGGYSDPGMMLKIAPQFARYMDEGKFHGAYGVRIGSQMIYVARKMANDRNTRQAVVTLWDSWLDNIASKHDYPCTIGLQFELDPFGGRLNMTTMMRSNDVWLGLPYDMFQFTQLQMSLARALCVEPGHYRHVALSMHLYSADVAKAERIVAGPSPFAQPLGIGRPGDCFVDIMKRAKRLHTDKVNEEETASEAWYRGKFETYLG